MSTERKSWICTTIDTPGGKRGSEVAIAGQPGEGVADRRSCGSPAPHCVCASCKAKPSCMIE